MKMKTIFITIFIAMASLALAGCATIVGGGSTQSINLSSSPAGASIWQGTLKGGEVINLVDTGLKTPTDIIIPRRGSVIVLKLDGHEDRNVALTTTVNGWFFGNIILGGLLGSSIDLTTGASQKFDPANFFLEMTATGGQSATTEEAPAE